MTLRDGIERIIHQHAAYGRHNPAPDAIIALLREQLTSDEVVDAAIARQHGMKSLDDAWDKEHWQKVIGPMRANMRDVITAALDAVLGEQP